MLIFLMVDSVENKMQRNCRSNIRLINGMQIEYIGKLGLCVVATTVAHYCNVASPEHVTVISREKQLELLFPIS